MCSEYDDPPEDCEFAAEARHEASFSWDHLGGSEPMRTSTKFALGAVVLPTLYGAAKGGRIGGALGLIVGGTLGFFIAVLNDDTI
jgi:hypothetical protein